MYLKITRISIEISKSNKRYVYFTIKLEQQRGKPSCRLHKGLKSTDVN